MFARFTRKIKCEVTAKRLNGIKKNCAAGASKWNMPKVIITATIFSFISSRCIARNNHIFFFAFVFEI